ncbi:hypothetical protein D9611_014842 [Ephemerocybe angulata]|uniref:Uncharacterized protein n=1 Tax=Ephemerocybe angulata TaxID=980116 RepID=A0A8H5BSS9_9AGAR|nr:hypothetical protein D9611_014842 [Tulosesus angulatus]
MFVAEFQWELVRLVRLSTSADLKSEWGEFWCDIVHLSRLYRHLLEEAERAANTAPPPAGGGGGGGYLDCGRGVGGGYGGRGRRGRCGRGRGVVGMLEEGTYKEEERVGSLDRFTGECHVILEGVREEEYEGDFEAW